MSTDLPHVEDVVGICPVTACRELPQFEIVVGTGPVLACCGAVVAGRWAPRLACCDDEAAELRASVCGAALEGARARDTSSSLKRVR